jgi:dynein heavy chain
MIALSQQFCKQNTLELDKLTVDTRVTTYTSANMVPSKPKNGRYISGMYIEGARFDMEKLVIKKQKPKVLIYDMPILHIEPVLISKLKVRDRYMCPT